MSKKIMIDAHIHIGQFEENYYTARDIFEILLESGVEYFVYSSVSSCIEGIKYSEIEKEIDNIYSVLNYNPDKVKPLLWIVPEYFKQGFDLDKFGELPYCGFKIHPRAHNWDLTDTKTIDICVQIFSFSEKQKVPILIHTGEDEIDRASKFQTYFEKYRNATIVLAHGRPFEDTLIMLERYPNVYVDTAFMPVETVIKIINKGFIGRIIFGTDFPITNYFNKFRQKLSLKESYQKDLCSINTLGKEYREIIIGNTMKIYKFFPLN